jgi:hypothetical protein
MWRQDRQQYSQVSYKDWLQVSVISASSDRYDTTKSKITESHYVRKGSKIVVYYFPKAISRGDSMLFQSQQNVKPRELRAQVDCLDWPSDIHPGAIVGRMSGLPLLRGIPMDITSSGKAYREWELRTKTFEHREDISPILFTMPPGLKKVAFSSAMFVSDDTKGVLDDYFSSAK